jgi:hypothetical protein
VFEDGDLVCLAPGPLDLLVAETHLAGLDAKAQPPVMRRHPRASLPASLIVSHVDRHYY